MDNKEVAVDKSNCIDPIVNKKIIDNYVLEDKVNDIESVFNNKCVKAIELSGKKYLRINLEVKNNNEKIDKCIEFTDRINKFQFDNDDIDNNYGVKDKREILENIKKVIVDDELENSKCNLNIKKRL